MSIKGIFLMAGVVAMLLFAAGCGDSDSSDTGDGSSSSGEVTVATNSLSKAEFVKQANVACAKSRVQFEKDLAAFLKKLNANPTKASEGSPDTEIIEKIFVPNFQEQIDMVSSLGAPSGDEAQVSAILSSLQKAVDGADEDPQAFVRSEGDLGNAPKLASAYGLTSCATLSS